MKKEKSFWIAVLAGFAVLAVGDILIHRIWLKEIYGQLAQFWRAPEEMKTNAWIPFLAEFVLAYLLALIYPKGYEKKGAVGEGIRFGILMGLLLHLPSTLIHYYVHPYPNYLLGVWFVGGVAEVVAASLAIAYAYEKGK